MLSLYLKAISMLCVFLFRSSFCPDKCESKQNLLQQQGFFLCRGRSSSSREGKSLQSTDDRMQPRSILARFFLSCSSSSSPTSSHKSCFPSRAFLLLARMAACRARALSTESQSLLPHEGTAQDDVPRISAAEFARENGIEIVATPREMTRRSCRTGAIAIKCGMTAGWDKWGARVPYTVLWFDDNIVTQIKVKGKDCTTALQIGCGQKKPKQLTKPELGHFFTQGVPLKRKLVEFPVSDDALLPVGTPISVRHFVPGQYVDIAGITIGKGFQGGMKRWGFAGMPASHGASLSHRSLGSTGGRQDPGKVFKGKKMAGRMGGKRRTVKSVWIHKIDPARNLMWVRGQVPGHAGNFVFVKDAFHKKPDLSITPFPTFFPDPDEDLSTLEPIAADEGDVDPFLTDK